MRVNFISRGRSFTGAHLISALELPKEWEAPQTICVAPSLSIVHVVNLLSCTFHMRIDLISLL